MFLISEAVKFLKANKLLTFFVILSTYLLFVILGFFIVASYQVFSYLNYVRKNIYLQAFTETNVSEADKLRISSTLSTLAGIDSISFKSNEDIYRELGEKLKEDRYILDEIDISQLPSAFVIKPKLHWTKYAFLNAIASKVEAIDGIEEVHFGGRWIRGLEVLSRILMFSSMFILAIIFFTFLFISSHAISISIRTHKDAIYILQLFGVDRRRIFTPFVLMGIFYGLVSSTLAYLTLNAAIFIMKQFRFEIFPFPEVFSLSIIPFGVLLGYISTLHTLSGLRESV